MLEKETVVKVTNRTSGMVIYIIPEMGNLRREFAAGETKEVTVEELKKLSWIAGGMELLRDSLLIDNEELVAELIGEVEPEYYYTKEKIDDVLTNGSLEEFEDLLDFAPKGTVEIARDEAIRLEVNDINKREAIKKVTGLDVTKAIEINKETSEENPEVEIKTRRAAAKSAGKTSGRRVVVKKEN